MIEWFTVAFSQVFANALVVGRKFSRQNLPNIVHEKADGIQL